MTPRHPTDGADDVAHVTAQRYTKLQITNPFWTLVEFGDRSRSLSMMGDVTFVLSIAAVIVFALNLPGIARELRHVRVAKPSRVAEEDAALQPAPEPVRTSPWG